MTTSTNPSVHAPSANAASVPRTVIHRTRGMRHGPITRLVSPSDVGELIKPFVFLDLFEADPGAGRFVGGWHPHSGIATVSVLFEGSARYEETTGANGILQAGGVEWMRAGKGVWHTGGAAGTVGIKGFQLWVALPPPLENAPNASQYLGPEELPVEGPARVVLGRHAGAQSPVAAPPTMNYLAVTLSAGERWTYVPPADHAVAWVALLDGALQTPAPVAAGELVVFERGNGALDFNADRATRFVLGSAVRHPHNLVLGNYSVHTTAAALATGEAEIRRIGAELIANGTLRR